MKFNVIRQQTPYPKVDAFSQRRHFMMTNHHTMTNHNTMIPSVDHAHYRVSPAKDRVYLWIFVQCLFGKTTIGIYHWLFSRPLVRPKLCKFHMHYDQTAGLQTGNIQSGRESKMAVDTKHCKTVKVIFFSRMAWCIWLKFCRSINGALVLNEIKMKTRGP